MKDLTKIYIDLKKCTEEQRKHIFSLLPREDIEGDYDIIGPFKFLHIIDAVGIKRWVTDSKTDGKQELTYPEFIKLFEKPKTVEESLKEYFRNTPKDQVIKDWESVSEFDNVNSPKVSELFEGGMADVQHVIGYDTSNQPIIPVRKKLSVKTNAHSNCDGTSWGWIEGCSLNICWSDENTRFNREKAKELVRQYNAR